MRRNAPTILALVFLLSVFGCSPAEEPRAAELELTVMSFNIRWSGFDDGENSWSWRKDFAADVIRRSGADVVGIQEASPEQVEDLLAALPVYRAFDAGDRSDVVPILYRADRFRRDRSGGFWLVETSDLSGGTRKCTWVRLVERSTGLAVRHFNLHLDHRSLPSRERSAVVLARHLSTLEPRDPFVITGDFNTTEDSPPMRFLRGELTLPDEEGEPVRNGVPLVDTYRVLHPDEERVGTAHGFRGGERGRKIDHVLVPAGTTVIRAGIRRDVRDGRYPSDHYPVTARVRFRERSPVAQ
jgi:endonuclease/exonuclease/phosphatase family metal-dependent hydrolase